VSKKWRKQSGKIPEEMTGIKIDPDQTNEAKKMKLLDEVRQPKEKFWTIAFQFDGDGERVDPPPHIEDRILACMQILHQVGWGLDIKWGEAPKDLLDQIEYTEN